MGTGAEDRVRALIAAEGRITFADFMETALYDPDEGYYSRANAADHADYYTSPETHPAFGALLCLQLMRMWVLLGRPDPFYAIEMGAGKGLLAGDVDRYARETSGEFADALRYVAVDRSRSRTRRAGAADPAQRVVSTGIPVRGVVGCLLSNELVDAFPVHRFQIQSGEVREVYVEVRDGRLQEVVAEASTPLLAQRIESTGLSLPEGYTGEVNLAIGPWLTEIAGALERGFVLTIDYGHEASDLYSPARRNGTIQTYYRHAGGSNPYARVGMQDITAHVDFTAMVAEGRLAGLEPVSLRSQAQWLHGLGLDRMLVGVRALELRQRERDANMMALRELAKPDGLGRFKVLVQKKGTGVTDPSQLAVSDEDASGDGPPKVPVLGPDHIDLMEGRYPHLGWEVEELWPSES